MVTCGTCYAANPRGTSDCSRCGAELPFEINLSEPILPSIPSVATPSRASFGRTLGVLVKGLFTLAPILVIVALIINAFTGWFYRNENFDGVQSFRDGAIGIALILGVFGILTLVWWDMWDSFDLIDWKLIERIFTKPSFIPSFKPSFAVAPKDDQWEMIEKLPDVEYYEYLESEEWKDRRNFIVRRAGGRCQVCNKTGALEVHHRTYERVGEERIDDLIALCRDCHGLFHDRSQISR